MGQQSHERAVHAHFAHLRISPNREWFRLSPEIDTFIAELEQGRRLLERRTATILDAINGTLRSKVMSDDLLTTVPQARRAYDAWCKKQKAAGGFASQEIEEQAHRCGLEIQMLCQKGAREKASLVRLAAAEFAKLEQMLAHDKSPVRH
mgnify:FL=1